MLACALPPWSGSLQLNGSDPWQLPRRQLQRLRGELFLAPQVPPLPPRQRVVTSVLAGRLPQIGLWQSLRSLFYPSAMAQADAALARFDLSDKLFARVDRLSGGERQRVGLARALVTDATLLLVDEPLSALDPARGRQAIASLTQAARERGATLVCTLHHVIINGHVRGSVHASEWLELQPKAIIEGNVSYKALEMHQGAVISGQLRPWRTSSWKKIPP